MGSFGGFLADFADGFKKPFVWAYDQADKRFNQVDKVADKAFGAADNILDIFGGNSSILVYGGLIIVGLIVVTTVVPKLIDKAV